MKWYRYLMLMVWAQSAFAQIGDSLDVPIMLDPEVRHGVLSNGITYYIRKNPLPVGKISLHLVVKAGFIDERDKGWWEVSHVLEHIVFRGTKNFKDPQGYFESKGIIAAKELNASTTESRTTYDILIPNSVNVINDALYFLLDCAQSIDLDTTKILSEKQIVFNEHMARQSYIPDYRKKYLKKILSPSPNVIRHLGDVTGNIENLQPDAVRDFYEQYYRPNLQAVVIVGDCDPDLIELLVRKIFSSISKPLFNGPKGFNKLKFKSDSSFVTDYDSRLEDLKVRMFFGKRPVERPRLYGDYKLLVLTDVINKLLSNRLKEIVLQKNFPLKSMTWSNNRNDLVGQDFWAFQATATINNPASYRTEFAFLITELERIKRSGFSDSELQNVKREIIYASRYRHQDSNELSEYYIKHYSDTVPAPGLSKEVQVKSAILSTLTGDDVNDFLRETLQMDSTDIIISGPDSLSKSIPSRNEHIKLWQQVAARKLKPLVVNRPLSDIMSRRQREKLVCKSKTQIAIVTDQLKKIKLDNGLELYINNSPHFRKEKIFFKVGRNAGFMNLRPEDRETGRSLAFLISSSRVNGLTQDELGRIFASKSVTIHPFSDETSSGFSGECVTSSFETAIQALYFFLDRPLITEKDFNQIIKQRKASMGSESSMDSIMRILSSWKAYRTGEMLLLPDLNQISFKKSLFLHQLLFNDLNKLKIVISGNFDSSEIEALAVKYLSCLKHEPLKYKFTPAEFVKPASGINLILNEGSEGRANVQIRFDGALNGHTADAAYLKVLSDVIQRILFNRIRNEENGTYILTCSPEFSANQKFSLVVSFECATERAAELLQVIKNEFEDIRKLKIPFNLIVEAKERLIALEKALLNSAPAMNEYYTSLLLSDLEIEDKKEVELLEKFSLLDLFTILAMLQPADESNSIVQGI